MPAVVHPGSLPPFLPAYLPACLSHPPSLPISIPTYLPTYLTPSLPTYLPTYLPTSPLPTSLLLRPPPPHSLPPKKYRINFCHIICCSFKFETCCDKIFRYHRQK